MEEITCTQHQKQLELDRRAWELDRQAFQLESEKKSFQLEMQQQKSQFEQQKSQFEQQKAQVEQQKAQVEQQVQSLNQREQSLNTRFNHIEQTLLDISSTPFLLQQSQQHRAEQHQAEQHVAEQHQAEQEHEEQHEEQHEVLSSLSSLSSHDNNQQSIIPIVPNFDMMINIYDQHLTTLAKTLKTTARKLAKKEIELNEKIEQYNLSPPEVVESKPSQDVVQQATQCITCEKCDKISELDQRQKALDQMELKLKQNQQVLTEGQEKQLFLLKQTHFTLSHSERGRIMECLTAMFDKNKDCEGPCLNISHPGWKWANSCNEFCWMMYVKRYEIKGYCIKVTFVRDDDRSYRCQYEFGLSYLSSPLGILNSFIERTLQKCYTNPITKISFSTPLINNGEWFTVEGIDLHFKIFFVSPQDVKMGINLTQKTLHNIDATVHEILFKVE